MKFDSIVIADINPEPWKPPRVGRNGAFPDPAFDAYRDVLREELLRIWGDRPPLEPPYQLRFFWWREIVSYHNGSRNVTKQAADQTNLQKAAEDCLQTNNRISPAFPGIIKNDRFCQGSGGLIVEQDKGVDPIIAIEIASEIPTTGVYVFPPLVMLDGTAELVNEVRTANRTIHVPLNNQ